MSAPLKVLIADDSSIFVEALREALEEDGSLHVVGVAQDGQEAVRMTLRQQPDLITMDVAMPVLDGFGAIERIMAERPTPILVLTGDTRSRTGELAMEALRRGALEVMPKHGTWTESPKERGRLRDHLRFLARVPVLPHMHGSRHRWHKSPTSLPAPARAPGKLELVAIAASTGGPPALVQILKDLPRDFTAGIVIVQHMAAGFSESLRSWLASSTPLAVRLATTGARPEPGVALLAPDGEHVDFVEGGRIRLTPRGTSAHCPSADVMFHGAARIFGAAAAGVVLTGMGDDGAAGLLALHRAGGVTLAQDEATSVVYGMPRAARELGAAQRVLPLESMAHALRILVPRASS